MSSAGKDERHAQRKQRRGRRTIVRERRSRSGLQLGLVRMHSSRIQVHLQRKSVNHTKKARPNKKRQQHAGALTSAGLSATSSANSKLGSPTSWE